MRRFSTLLFCWMALSGCTWIFRELAPDECDEATFVASCSGSVLSACREGFQVEVNCGELLCEPSSGVCVPSICGDASVNGTEDCDGVNLDGQDCTTLGLSGGTLSCSAGCTFDLSACLGCGNGIVEPPEACDDGNFIGGDGCSACIIEFCGDGIDNNGAAESCDDGNPSNTDACTNACQLALCGDGFVLDANGNGVVDAGDEECDDGNPFNGDGCSDACVREVIGICGDGVLNLGEQCDDHNTNSGDGCNSSCFFEFCRDGVVQPALGENCDDGNANNNDACPLDCTLAVCGDFVVESAETCDDGNALDNDGCSAGCIVEVCGDNTINNGDETCDDGNVAAGDGCSDLCIIERCGDGIVNNNGTEQCDLGVNNSDTGACTALCQSARCGDSLVQRGVEGCDDGNAIDTDACTNACTLPNCGDGTLQAGEQCDLGAANTNTGVCTLLCQNASCGDTLLQSGVEECDDGNNLIDDGCNAGCIIEVCGDSIVNNRDETCDDGNTIAGDGCDASCLDEFCGDGITNDTSEACDDANNINDDTCPNDCTLPVCGDLNIEGVEQCDDGNVNDGDGCSRLCILEQAATCGDGSLQAGEQCDDGNTNDFDGCESNCALICGNGSGALRATRDEATDHCYLGFPSDNTFTWFEAASECEAIGGYLTRIDSAEENNLARASIPFFFSPWIGFQDFDNEAFSDPFGFVGVDGLPLTFNGFSTNEPNNSGAFSEEDCAHFFPSNFFWNDLTCIFPDIGSGYICELNPNPCGDRILQDQIGEECDDGNTTSGDGCSSVCLLE